MVLHLSGDTRTHADAYPYAQPRTLRPKPPSTVRDVPWLALGHTIDSRLRSQRMERPSPQSLKSSTCA